MKKITSSLIALTLVLGASASAFASGVSTMAIYNEYEPNNSRSEANSFFVAHGNQITGSLGSKTNGTIDHQDIFTFTATANQKVRFQIAKSSAQDFRLTIDGTTLETTPSKNYVDIDLVAGKQYYFRVEAYAVNYDNPDLTYSVYTYVL